MGRLLARINRWFSLGTLALAVVFVLTVSPALGTSYQGWITGYAFGNQTGASGAVIAQGDFANHSPTYCPSDPAASWAWGTSIQLISNPSVIYLVNSMGNYRPTTTFGLWDNGDTACSMGNYWVDIYFGRYTWTPSNCNCPGSPSPGYCIYGSANNCQDATDFGQSWGTYQ